MSRLPRPENRSHRDPGAPTAQAQQYAGPGRHLCCVYPGQLAEPAPQGSAGLADVLKPGPGICSPNAVQPWRVRYLAVPASTTQVHPARPACEQRGSSFILGQYHICSVFGFTGLTVGIAIWRRFGIGAGCSGQSAPAPGAWCPQHAHRIADGLR
jgi:hypothetical protein